jgi:two-component system sensor kinase FixL
MTGRRRLAEHFSNVVEQERALIGADLHDGLGQELTGLALLLQALARRAEIEGPGLVPEICRLSRMANAAVASVHNVAHRMLPLELRHGDFKYALQELARSSRRAFGVQIAVRCCGEDACSPKERVAEQLYRIAQEAVTNAVRHGRAARISLCVRSRALEITLTVSDNGVGFENGCARGGMGLHIMRYRARILGGLLDVRSVRPHGTRILCVVPLDARQ